MAKNIEEHAAEIKATFDQWYAQNKQVAMLVGGTKTMMDNIEAPDEITAHMLEGLGLMANKAFLAGSTHGSKLTMTLIQQTLTKG